MNRIPLHQTADYDLQRVQAGVRKVVNPALGKAILDGVLLRGVVLKAGGAVNAVQHGLQRTYRGWILADANAQASVWSQPSAAPALYLNLLASAPVTVSLWVF
jgi:hypothetical protein